MIQDIKSVRQAAGDAITIRLTRPQRRSIVAVARKQGVTQRQVITQALESSPAYLKQLAKEEAIYAKNQSNPNNHINDEVQRTALDFN